MNSARFSLGRVAEVGFKGDRLDQSLCVGEVVGWGEQAQVEKATDTNRSTTGRLS